MNIYTRISKTLATVDAVKPHDKKKRKKNKIRALERKRYSILTENLTECFICKKPKNTLHEIYPGRNRQNSMRYGFVIPLCRKCHYWLTVNPNENDYYKQMAQKKYEETHTREEFMDIIHRNYL